MNISRLAGRAPREQFAGLADVSGEGGDSAVSGYVVYILSPPSSVQFNITTQASTVKGYSSTSLGCL